MCVIEKVIEGDYQFFNDDGRMVHIEFVKGIVFAELKLWLSNEWGKKIECIY